MRASTPSVQSKSHVLAGVQDAYWSDDETVSRKHAYSYTTAYEEINAGGR